MASKHLLALAYASGQHDGLLAIDPESFLQRWERTIDARALMPTETGAAATNAYNTAMALATTEAARLAIKVLKATSNERSFQFGWKGEKLSGDSRRRGLPVVFSALKGVPQKRHHFY